MHLHLHTHTPTPSHLYAYTFTLVHLDTGLVYKVVMATVSAGITGELQPVIVDEIQLADSMSVKDMKLEVQKFK